MDRTRRDAQRRPVEKVACLLHGRHPAFFNLLREVRVKRVIQRGWCVLARAVHGDNEIAFEFREIESFEARTAANDKAATPLPYAFLEAGRVHPVTGLWVNSRWLADYGVLFAKVKKLLPCNDAKLIHPIL